MWVTGRVESHWSDSFSAGAVMRKVGLTNFEGFMSTLRGIYVNQTERFGLGGLLQLLHSVTAYKPVLYAVDKRPRWPKRPASVVIYSATYLLMISLLDIITHRQQLWFTVC